jgi:hypothetical protein
VARDLLRRQPPSDEPENLDLPIGEREVGTRAVEENAPRDRPANERAKREQRRSADIHGGTSDRGLRRRRSRSARPLQRAALLRADDLVLEALEEELPAAARAKRLIRRVPDGGLTAGVGVRGSELLERRTPGTGRHEDLPESMSAEIAVELSANGHLEPPRRNHPKNGARAFLVPYTHE